MCDCTNCGGSCQGCGALQLHEGELRLLQTLGQYAFLPVARRAQDMVPIYLEESEYSVETYSLILQCLQKRQLIVIDYDAPLKGCDMSAYGDYPVWGSICLTARGQLVLQLLEIQGIQ